MSLLLHAITPPDAGVTPSAGLRGHPLVSVVEQDLAAWATEFAENPGQLTRADLLAHHELISRLDEQLDSSLPARLPTWITDVDAVRRLLVARRAELSKNLERVHGRAELAVTIAWTTAEPETPSPEALTPGTRYLLRRRQAFAVSDQRRALAGELAHEVQRLAAPDLVEMQRYLCPSKAVAVSAALLVPRTSAAEVSARIRRMERDVRILVNGPWPPYSFVDVR